MSQKLDRSLARAGKFAWSGKYQHLFYMLVFCLFAFLAFQYWLTLNPPPGQGQSASSVGGVNVQLSTPEHLSPGNENQQEFELIIDYAKIPAFTILTINLESPDPNVGFSREVFGFTNDSTYEETNKAVVYYKETPSPAKSFEVRASVKLGTEEGLISRTIRVDHPFENILVLLSGILAGGLALLNLLKLVGDFWGNRTKA